MHRLLWMVLLLSSVCLAEEAEDEDDPPRLIEEVATPIGKLEIRTRRGPIPNRVAILDGEFIYASMEEHLNVVKVFHTRHGEVALFSEDAGGSGTRPTHRFILLRKNEPPVISPILESQDGRISTKQQGDVIEADLGFDEGKRVTVTYQNGKQTLSRAAPRKGEPAAEEDCKYLYEQVYVEFIQDGSCDRDPENYGGMAITRSLYHLGNDPRLDLKGLYRLSTQSCKERKPLAYPDFMKRICSGEAAR
ncbi:hypothetical protein P2318_04375 [Myxococcaceae bacterium GXIMD 01537]